VPTRLLETTLNAFPPGTPDFVSHSVLGAYIQDTAVKTGIHQVTQYDTEVKKLSKRRNEWILEAATLYHPTFDTVSTSSSESLPSQTSTNSSQSIKTHIFDAVVVASGHYHAPRIPDIPGLATSKQQWPTRIQHSKGYRKPEGFRGQNVLLIGASVSSTDIARELGPFANTIYQSHRNGKFDLPASLLPDNALRIEEVISLHPLPDKGTADLLPDGTLPLSIQLKSGRTLCKIHTIILCTGYHTTLPFLPSHYAPNNTAPTSASPTTLITDGVQLHNLHKDIFYIPDPTLLFIGVPYFTATFTLFEFQAMVAAKVVAGKVRLPEEAEMRSEYEERVKRKGYGKGFHSLREAEGEYVDEIIGWANGQLEGGERLSGHTQAWKEGKREHTERIRALLAGGNAVEREFEVIC
jgi:ACS family pantothenate transporter-like MFS transporter